MKTRYFFSVFVTLLNTAFFSQPADSKIASISNHNEWGWTSIVQTNGIITLATVPAIGARIMQYDLDDHKYLYINPNEIGKTYIPSKGGFHGFGGYVVWPGPQYSRWGWPPPPILDYGTYQSEIVQNLADSTCISVSSETEKWQAPGLHFERRMTVYKGTSRVKVDQVMINEALEEQSWSIWDVTQTIANSIGNKYWVYFPINPNSEHGDDGVYFRNDENSSAWQGEVATEIYGVVFKPEGKKLFADPDKGWIGYVDEGKSKAYIKSFKIFEEEIYPGDNGGGRVQVYLGPSYYEVEVASPIVNLKANGGRYSFIQNWYATTINGPILDVNSAGAIETPLYQSSQTNNILGTFGVFHIGTAKLVAKDSSGVILAEGITHNITPFEKLVINEALELPEETTAIEIVVYDYSGNEVGPINTLKPEQITLVESRTITLPNNSALLQNYPNPFNPITNISYSIANTTKVTLKVYDILGRVVETLINRVQLSGKYTVNFNAQNISGGIYFYKLEAGSFASIKKLVVLK
ncbi:MAG: T9SS type A sorting domain-containing protein [Melioribacteraceae bacterium]|nr:T9SS type A sorting domain-containing protein [Melioribacteraceae bacterium]